MARQVTINGLIFKLGPANDLVVAGAGIYPPSGTNVSGNVSSTSLADIKSVTASPNVTDPARQEILTLTEADLEAIKTGLIPPPRPPPPPPPPEPTPPAETEQQNKTFVASGSGDDDSGKTSASNNTATSGDEALQAFEEAQLAQQEGSAFAQPAAVTSGTTVSGKSDTPIAKKEKGPGKRLKNPLSDFSSFNYQITLYMITPDAYNAFITSGRTNINAFANVANTQQAQQSFNEKSSGVYIVAQSGGINNSSSNRAPGFDLDYYIDNLEINSAVSMGKSSNSEGPVNTSEFKFQIIEPYGFSFITKLKNAQNSLQQYVSSLPNIDKNPFADRANFILGIRFLGYDSQGNIINNLARLDNNIVNQQGGTGNFEKFYDIKLRTLKFKLDGRTTIYNVEAVACSVQEGMGIKNGRILTDTTVVGGTVGETIDSLVTQLNKAQTQLLNDKGCEIPTKYKVVYLGEDSDLIKNASVVNTVADSDKSKFPVPPTTNVSTSINATPQGNQRQLVFKGAGSTSIVQALQTIVTQSEYIQKAIKNLYQNTTEPDIKTKEYQTADENSNKILKWVNVSAEVLNLGYDRVRKDWSYEITYVVQTYSTPFVTVTVAPNVTKYPGPVKRYEYWLTGKNTEVKSFELVYNQLYTTIALANIDNQKDITYPIPTMVGHRISAPRQGRLGPALESQNAYVNNLNDPGAYATVKMTIMGDPDWLIQDSSPTTADINQIYDRYYGLDGYTINCNNGQVFVEVDIKEAIDYDNNQGIMNINDKILFFDYPKIYKEGPNKIEGISLQATNVVSNFRGGKFEQTLTLIAGIWADVSSTNNASTTEAERETLSRENFRRLEINATNTTNPANATGLVAAPNQGTNNETGQAYTRLTGINEETGQIYTLLPGLQTSPTGAATNKPVADDDASSTSRNSLIRIPSGADVREAVGKAADLGRTVVSNVSDLVRRGL